jgi:Zn ribbon nucleic-acid-binding protein
MASDFLEVIECDWCGFNEAVESELAAELLGWRFTSGGTMCPACPQIITVVK